MNIAAAGNSETACLQLILDKGYHVVAYEEKNDCSTFNNEFSYTYTAAKDDATFSAFSIMELLGLICLGETWGKDWQRKGLGKSPDSKIEIIEAR